MARTRVIEKVVENSFVELGEIHAGLVALRDLRYGAVESRVELPKPTSTAHSITGRCADEAQRGHLAGRSGFARGGGSAVSCALARSVSGQSCLQPV